MQVNILGTRGIPAAHGGFETFVHRLAPYLVGQGHDVLVYCQPDHGPKRVWQDDHWRGVRRRSFVPRRSGSRGTIEFDWACVRDVCREPGVDLVLGYNTAVFNLMQRIRRRRVVMNMDGIEWQRSKWSAPVKAWFFANEIAGANLCHAAIADHPEIATHVAERCRKTPVMIPYGADAVGPTDVGRDVPLGLTSGRYFISIARLEPENSILEIVQAASALPGTELVVLGRLEPGNAYHQAVQAAAGPNVRFPGAIYDPAIVQALRVHCRAYLHGHQVGGTNPSLVEALGAGNAVIAHDNRFNRWTAGSGQLFFRDGAGCKAAMTRVLTDPDRVMRARAAARRHHAAHFQWDDVLRAYERLLLGQLSREGQRSSRPSRVARPRLTVGTPTRQSASSNRTRIDPGSDASATKTTS